MADDQRESDVREWVPTGVKVGLNEVPAVRVGDKDETALFDRNVVMIGNMAIVCAVVH